MKRKFFITLKMAIFLLAIYLRSRDVHLEAFILQHLDVSQRLEFALRSLVNYAVFLLGFNLLIIFPKSVYRRRQGLPPHAADNVLAGLDNIYLIVSSIATVVLILGFFGIEPRSLLTGLSIVAAAIAIITKEYIANVIGGIAISFSDEISIGDYIKMDAYKGRVTDITISRIALLTLDDEVIYIPHSKIWTSEVINYTKSGIRRVSIEFEISIHAINTVENFEQDLIENISEYHEYIEQGSFWLKIQDVLKDSVKMKFQFVLKSIDTQLEREIRKKTVRSIVNHIRKHQMLAGH